MSIKLGWAGVGHIHTPGFSGEVLKRGIECAGVYDHDSERAKKNAENLKGPVQSLAELAGNDAVTGYVVTSETVHHLEIVSALAKTGKPIFIEKPVGFDAAQSKELLKVLTENRNMFSTGYFSRGGAGVQTLKKLVDEGHFGTITRVRASNCHSGALGGWFDTDWRWMADKSRAGVGAFGDLGTHVLDLVLWMFGPIRSVTGAFSNGTARYEGCEELGEAMLKFTNGIIGTMAAGWNDVADPYRLMVMGTKGYATLGAELKVAGEDGKLAVYESLEPAKPAGFNGWLDALEGKPADLVTPREATNRDVVMSAIYQGAEQDKWVDISSSWH
ncbi:MAG: Gfo/Idh/MocA family oxidoreductase [Armatimonadota bacterium]